MDETSPRQTAAQHESGDGLLRPLRSPTSRRFLVTVGVLAFAVESVLLVVIPPATGFESSLIAAYPPVFWAVFTVVLVTATLLFVAAGAFGSGWRAGFLLLAANYGVFFFLPLHRGYHLYDRSRADSLGHLGMVKEVLIEGSAPVVFYPLEHLLIAEFSMTGFELAPSRYLFSFLFTLLFIASVGILLRRLTGQSRAVGFGLLGATPLVFAEFQVRIHPAIFSFMLVPVVLYLVERIRDDHDLSDVGALLLVAAAVVFFHPMTTVLLCLVLATVVVFQRVYRRLTTETPRPISPYLPLVVVPTAVTWYLGFNRTKVAVQGVLFNLFGSGDRGLARDQLQQAQEGGLSLAQLLVRLFQKYGVVLLVCVLAGLFVLHVLLQYRRRRTSYADTYVSTQFVVGVGVTIAFLFMYLVAFDPIRVSRYMITMAVIAVGMLAYRANEGEIRVSGRPVGRAVTVVVVLGIVAAALLGTFVGTTYWVNMHMTEPEYQGTEFVLDNHDPGLHVWTHHISVKMQWYIYGDRTHHFPFPMGPDYQIPERLGYLEHDRASATYGEAYVVTNEHDTTFYQADYFTPRQRETLFLYDESDVARMGRDPTVNHVYTNGGFEGWLVQNGTSSGAPS
ncbi:hypothetical protein N0B31_19930 [Salinirubellus salinus]|uniref:Uncharacterized protein n=1 Tax=Salinirubellus salinus TaxID=1364945 RepID=A0A9E7R288_9EURY|nr:hypothetical protein [Salinirubellus salinus]UWM54374.1 hypothetical protein N0B31_19930 [Salinirubellus salinus]